MEAPAPESVRQTPVTEGRIGREFYEDTDYFEGDAAHITDLESPFQRYRVSKVLELFEPGPEARVVDLGCGWGTFCFALGHRVKEMVGVDFSQRSVDLCNAGLETRGLPGVRFVRADARDTGLAEGVYDLVIAADLVEHLYPDDTIATLEECRRILKPGGRISIWTPHRGHVLEVLKNRGIILKRDVSHVDYKSLDRLKNLLHEAGFLVEKAYYAESHVPGLRGVEKAFLEWVPLLRRRIAVLARRE